MKRYLLVILLSPAAHLCCVLPAAAQSPTGTFVGRVWDATTAAIPNATITARRPARKLPKRPAAAFCPQNDESIL